MSEKRTSYTWNIIGASCRGANHIRSNLPNQDAIGWNVPDSTSYPFILAIADGHGSTKSFRSHRGAQIAVTIAKEVLMELYLGIPATTSQLSSLKDACENRVPDALSIRWRKRVSEDIAADPITDEELRNLEDKDGIKSRTMVTDSGGILAYGATLLAVLIAEEYALYLQLGDGDIFTVSEDGSVSRPLPGDPRLFANETTSLSSKNAQSDFRIAFRILGNVLPALIFISTDGYANSYANDDAFIQVPADYLKQMRNYGLRVIESQIEGWLEEVSKGGSGDDVTLGLIWRESAPVIQADEIVSAPCQRLLDDHSVTDSPAASEPACPEDKDVGSS